MTEEQQAMGFQLVTAAATGMIDLVRMTLDSDPALIHFEDDLALRSASFTGNVEVVKLLVEKGANVQASGNEALLYAAKQRNDSTVEFLLSKGADIDNMIRMHKRELDQDALDTLDKYQSQKLRDAFEKNFSRIRKPEDPQKFKLPKQRPPTP